MFEWVTVHGIFEEKKLRNFLGTMFFHSAFQKRNWRHFLGTMLMYTVHLKERKKLKKFSWNNVQLLVYTAHLGGGGKETTTVHTYSVFSWQASLLASLKSKHVTVHVASALIRWYLCISLCLFWKRFSGLVSFIIIHAVLVLLVRVCWVEMLELKYIAEMARSVNIRC